MIKVVVFDLDGTLYDYEKCNLVAEEHLLSRVCEEFCITHEVAKKLLKDAKAEVKKQLGNVAASHNRLLYVQKMCELQGKNPLDFGLRLYHNYWDKMLGEMQLFSYVLPLFDLLRMRGIKIGVLTDLTAQIQYRKLNKLGISDYIDYFVTSEEVGKEKPACEIFAKMLEKAGCMKEDILMIGDSKERDVEGALSFGMQALLFTQNEDILQKVEDLL